MSPPVERVKSRHQHTLSCRNSIVAQEEKIVLTLICTHLERIENFGAGKPSHIALLQASLTFLNLTNLQSQLPKVPSIGTASEVM